MSEVSRNKPDIVKRTMGYSIEIIKLYRSMTKDDLGRVIGKQLLRSGTSIGANVHEAQGAQSKADFNAKMYVAYKEARETVYWLSIAGEAGISSGQLLVAVKDETHQLVKILSSILLTSKNNMRNRTHQSSLIPHH